MIAAVHLIYQDRIDGQNARNAYLEEQIVILEERHCRRPCRVFLVPEVTIGLGGRFHPPVNRKPAS